jgi:hypothetical protein
LSDAQSGAPGFLRGRPDTFSVFLYAPRSGLLVATFCTLFFVPVVYSLLHRKQPRAMSTEEAELLA